ncbi:hemagglutinin repeat-containing protein [uncultured Photobacterium sp.]|uniref:hemagglutinin repeat-containing protein n=1 Tax=uncultured Photobacterium sp. TaxID=173973 RepID=UPI002617D927|nr:hemagglutinin repeat-containing protein [uncultured Photobacterium sp.]
MKIKKFTLSSSGKIAATIAITLASIPSYSAGIISTNGGPSVSTASTGAEVVNIIKPNQNGLSHNKYNQFNVNKPGVVLNNSLNAGQSQLAGKLGANLNLQGQTANIILNEVISRNPSLLLGKQEVFGMAADYVLANPNGITCDGCGFINTNHSSLVVGNPLIENGKLDNFITENNNKLQVNDNGLMTDSVLDLIAPSIIVKGAVNAKDINAITGHNQVSRDTLSISSIKQLPNAVDSYYLGSMQAGRIRIINTAEGSGVNIAGRLTGKDVVHVDAKGNLLLAASHIEGDDIELKAQQIRSKGKVTSDTTRTHGSKNYQNYRGGIDVNGQKDSQHLARTELVGKNISIVAEEDNHLTATVVRGDDVLLQGENLTLDGQQLTQKQRNTNNNWFYSWVHDSTTTTEKTEQKASVIEAGKTATLKATKGDINIQGAKVKAGEKLTVDAAHDVMLAGIVEKNKRDHHRNLRNHTSSLITGKSYDGNENETLQAAELTSGGSLGITAKNDVQSQGVKVHSKKDLIINAEHKIDINVQQTANNKIIKDGKTYWGGIGGGNNQNNSNSSTISHRSDISSDGYLLVSAHDGINITGSKVSGKAGGFVQTQDGGLRIDNAVSTFVDNIDTRQGTAFNITKNSNKSAHSTQTIHGSELVSDADLKLLSNKDIVVVGSLVQSAGTLGIESLGAINVKAAEKVEKLEQTKTDLTVKGYVKEKGDKQYRVGVRVEHTTETENTTKTEHVGSSLESGSVDVNAKKDVMFKGSNIKAMTGDATVSGDNVAFLAEADKTETIKTKDTVGGGVYYTAGIDKIGSGLEAGFEKENTQTNKEQAVVSKTDVAGNLIVNAENKLTQQGAEHKVQGVYKESAENIDHLAAVNKEETTTTTASGGGDIGANIDYSGVTRPIEKAAKKLGKADVMGAIDDIATVGAPNLGLDVNAEGKTTEHVKTDTTATVTKITAGNIDVNAEGSVRDQGTQYSANQSDMKLKANQHIDEAAKSSQSETTKETHGAAGFRVYTTTGQDVSVDVNGDGGNQSTINESSQAVTGTISAKNNIDINVTRDAVYQGTDFKTEQANIGIKAGGDVKLEQASNTRSATTKGLNAHASVNVGTNPDGKSGALGLGGGVNNSASESSFAVAGSMTSSGKINIEAGHDVSFQGNKVGSTSDTTVTAGNRVIMNAAESHSKATGSNIAGDINFGGSSSNTKESTGGSSSIGGSAQLAFKNENTADRQGTEFTSGSNFMVTAGSHDKEAIYGQSAQVNAKSALFNADNGGIKLESAQSDQNKNNWNLGLSGNASIAQSFDKDGKGNVDPNSGTDTHNLKSGLSVGVDKLHKESHQYTHVNATNVTITSQNDTVLAGAKVYADTVTGSIGDRLHVESRNDVEQKSTVNINAGLGHTNDAETSMTSKLSKIGTSHYSEKLKQKLDKTVETTATKVTDKYNTFARRHDPKQDTTGSVSFNKATNQVTLPEKLTDNSAKEKTALWDRGARAAGNGAKSALTGAAGRTGHFGINVDVVNKNAVSEQSGIHSNNGIQLDVKGSTQLTGAVLTSQTGAVSLADSKVVTQDMNGYRNQYGGRLDVPFTVGGLTGALAKSIANGESPVAIQIDPNQVMTKSKIGGQN